MDPLVPTDELQGLTKQLSIHPHTSCYMPGIASTLASHTVDWASGKDRAKLLEAVVVNLIQQGGRGLQALPQILTEMVKVRQTVCF